MTKFVTLTAAAALLSGAVATAQTMNANVDMNSESAAMMQTDTDDMTIEELNAWQLNRLVKDANAELPVEYAENTEPVMFKAEPVKNYTEDETGTTLAEEKYGDMSAMGGPEYMSEKDATAGYAITQTIADVTADDARFSTLYSLLKKTNLDAELMADGPFTVFAPTNAAFEKLDSEMANELMADTPEAREKLKGILKAHVVSGKYTASDFTEVSTTLDTIGNTELMIEVDADGNVKASEAAITTADVTTGNGVIHIIDDVIVPETKDAPHGSVLQ